MIRILRKGMPIVGYAKIGQPGAQHPEKFDHIELTGRARDASKRLEPDVELMRELLKRDTEGIITTCGGCPRSKDLGFEKGLPTRLPILLPYNDLELVIPNRLAWYKAGIAYCVGDGQTAQRLEVVKQGTRNIATEYGDAKPHSPCAEGGCPDFGKSDRCKPRGRLRFMLGVQQTIGGCYEFQTTSWNSIANLVEGLRVIQSQAGGTLVGIPLFFEISKQTVRPKAGPQNTAWIASVVFRGSQEQLLEAVERQLRVAAPRMQEIRKLEREISKGTVWSDEPEDIEAEEAEFGGSVESAPQPESAPTSEPSTPAEDPLASLQKQGQTSSKSEDTPPTSAGSNDGPECIRCQQQVGGDLAYVDTPDGVVCVNCADPTDHQGSLV